MKTITNKSEYLKNALYPETSEKLDLINALNLNDQNKFNVFIKSKGIEENGTLEAKELAAIENIKIEIRKLRKDYNDTAKDRLEFDLAKIFHSNLKSINIGRWQFDDLGMWRWISMNYFLEEVRWRRAEEKLKKGLFLESAQQTFNHLIADRARDIFPRRYFLLGERLFDSVTGYSLIDQLATVSRKSNSGGFGNLIANLIETRLLSPNEHVSKTISKVLFSSGKPADDKEVAKAFVRYNGYKRRLLNTASEEVFKKEICLL
jgi:hypothetical protein